MSQRLNVGVFVRTLKSDSPAEERFQASVLDGLRRVQTNRFHFCVFAASLNRPVEDDALISYHELERHSRFAQAAAFVRLQAGGVIRFVCRLLGLGDSAIYKAITGWMRHEPAYYAQLRDMNVRIMWNVNQHELTSPVPSIRTIWDVNHRIHGAYPEFSHTRFTFDGLDAGMARSLARAAYVIVGTEEGKRQVVHLFGVYEPKIRVIPLPTPALPAPPGDHAATSSQREAYLFYPARFWPHKNHVVILEALKRLRERSQFCPKCVFAGIDAGNLAYVRSYARALGVEDRIEYVGVISDAEVASFYQHAFALVYASAVGPDNLPPLEAMSLGCPVITADVPGAREQYGDAALFFDPMDDAQLADRIKELVQTPSLRQSLMLNGRQRASRWTANDYARAVVGILEEFALVSRAWEKADAVFT